MSLGHRELGLQFICFQEAIDTSAALDAISLPTIKLAALR